ncbi:MAG: rod shape determining protein RodA [Bacillota bacterium]|nr:rod shape determining protein RodA [Bacillota bacterium]
MFDRRLLKNLDFVIIGAVAALTTISLFIIMSASPEDPLYFVKRQLVWVVIGLVAFVITLSIDYHDLGRYARHLYYLNLALLLATLVLGSEAKGAQRWLQFGPVVVQPSEFAKIIIIITLAQLLSEKASEIHTLKDLVPVFVHVGVPMALILKQPDLGTSLVFAALLFVMLFVAGVRWQYLAGLAAGGAAAAPLLFHFLKDYQKKRLLVFLDPSVDPTGSGYHVIQSMIAIGSGRLWGKGLFGGTQNRLGFLPEQHTDFIFSVIGEELGFVRAAGILALYFIIIYRGIRVAARARDDFGTLLATGVVTMLAFHVLVNVGMTTGIMPVTGIPLPFMSYGGSSYLTNMIALGLLLNVHMRRHKILF